MTAGNNNGYNQILWTDVRITQKEKEQALVCAGVPTTVAGLAIYVAAATKLISPFSDAVCLEPLIKNNFELEALVRKGGMPITMPKGELVTRMIEAAKNAGYFDSQRNISYNASSRFPDRQPHGN
jgi:hypothetical protein